MTIDIERNERSGFCNNSDHCVSPHKRKTSLGERLYIEVKCEQTCSLVMLAEPDDKDRKRQSCKIYRCLARGAVSWVFYDDYDILDVQERGVGRTEAYDV